MNKREIIERLKNIARHAVHNVGEKPFVMSIDDGIAVHEAIELLENPETNCSEIPNNCPAADVVPVVRCDDCVYYGSRRWCELHSSVFDDNAFCSYGERKVGEQE